MTHIPIPPTLNPEHQWGEPDYTSTPPTINVTPYPLDSKPIGFAPWPKPKKRKKGKR